MKKTLIITSIVVVLTLGICCSPTILDLIFVEDVNCHVTNKEAVPYNKDIKYYVYTDKGVYLITDQLVYMKFNSSDIYNSIDIGSDYNLTVTGIRLPFLSMYKNIKSVNITEYEKDVSE